MNSSSVGSTAKPLICASELEIVRSIFKEANNVCWYLDFMIAPVLGEWHERRGKNWSFGILCFTERTTLGLEPGVQPGDINVLVVPRRNGRWHPAKAMAIEVKILRLSQSNRNKHPRPSGMRQAKGLVRDGFPFVGLLHLILTEPSPPEEWKAIMHARVIDDFGHVEILGQFPTDTIGTTSAERQYGRLLRKIEGSCVGANSLALSTDEKGFRINGHSTLATSIRPTPNPQVSRKLLRKIRKACAKIFAEGHATVAC